MPTPLLRPPTVLHESLFCLSALVLLTFKYLFMKYILLLLCLSFGTLSAQPFYGFQTIAVHTCYVSLGFGQQADLGFGYQFRDFNRAFTDWSVELRYPRNKVWQKGHAEVRVGFYRPLDIKRNFSALGFHIRMEQRTQGETTRTNWRGVLSLSPGRVLTSSLSSQKPYATASLRISYAPVLFSRTRSGSEKSSWQPFPAHTIEAGGHLDLVLRQTFSASSSLLYQYTFSQEADFKPQPGTLPIQGDIYAGAGYFLRRW